MIKNRYYSYIKKNYEIRDKPELSLPPLEPLQELQLQPQVRFHPLPSEEDDIENIYMGLPIAIHFKDK